MKYPQKIALIFIFSWFAIGGAGHFIAPAFFLKIIPPVLPLRLPAVYISGLFELLGAAGLLFAVTRRIAGIGLFLLSVAVTPANVYMWRHPELFPAIAPLLLMLRLWLQAVLLAVIAWVVFAQRQQEFRFFNIMQGRRQKRRS